MRVGIEKQKTLSRSYNNWLYNQQKMYNRPYWLPVKQLNYYSYYYYLYLSFFSCKCLEKERKMLSFFFSLVSLAAAQERSFTIQDDTFMKDGLEGPTMSTTDCSFLIFFCVFRWCWYCSLLSLLELLRAIALLAYKYKIKS